jgi:hypothetical protein
MKFRKKPVVFEAYRFGFDDPPVWAKRAAQKGILTEMSQYGGEQHWCEIETLEGTMRAEVGDYIIRGVKGELYPCKPDVFAATYEPVEEDTP